MYQVASHAGVIHSQSRAFPERSRSAGDAQDPISPFSVLLDEATEAALVPVKSPCEPPQASHAALPLEQVTPDQATTLPTIPLPDSKIAAEALKTASEIRTAAEIVTVTPADGDHCDTADTADASSTTLVLSIPDIPQLPPQQPPTVAMIVAVAPLETQLAPVQSAEQPITAAGSASQTQSSPVLTAPAPLSPTKSDPAQEAATPSQTPPDLGPETSATVTAPAMLPEQVPASKPAANTADTSPVNLAEPHAQAQQPTATDIAPQPAPEPEQAAVTSASAISAQPIETAQQAPTANTVQTPGADAPKGASRSEVAVDRSQTNGLPSPTGPGANGLQTAAAAQSSNKGRGANSEQKNTVEAAKAGSADGEHNEGQPEPTTADKKEHPAVVSTASRVGMPSAESAPGPRGEARIGDAAPSSKNPDATQVINLQAPADRVAVPASPAVQLASSHDATAAAVPLAGLAIEIAARAKTEGNRFEIRLDPPELGRIDVRLDIDRSGQITSRLVVDRVETLDALRRDAGDLERALQQAGLKTSENGLQFALRDQSFAGRDQSLPTPGAPRAVVPAPELAAIDVALAGYGRVLRSGGGIDIRI